MLPILFNDAHVDGLDSVEFDRQWRELMLTWMPTIDELRELSSNDVESLSIQPLPVDAGHEAFMLAIKRRALAGLEYGRRQGWWRAYTEEGPLPNPRKVFLVDYADKTMAHVMADLGFFPSVSQARKNGWDRPVTTGLFKVGKNWVKSVEIS